MAISGNIYQNLQAPDVLGGVERGLRMSDMLQQREAQRNEQERQNKMNQILKGGMTVDASGQVQINPESMSALAGVAKPQELMQYSQQMQAQQKAMMEQAQGAVKQGAAILQAVRGKPELWGAARGQLAGIKGLDMSMIPELYDEKQIDFLSNKAMTVMEQIQKAQKDREFALDEQVKKSQISKNYADVAKTKAEMPTKTNVKLTEGQKSVDKDYAKEYNEWTSSGSSGLNKNLQRLESAKKMIQDAGGDTSGRFRGRAPDILRSERNIEIEQDVRSAAQGALKATLGAQFTEKEGERIMKMAYDPTLSPEANIKKIDLAIQELKQNAANNEAKRKYFEQNGTLQGFKAGAQEKPQKVYQNGVEYNLNPETGEYE